MYDYHSAGETSLEGLINFFRELLHRWGKAGARHLVTIILTTRLWFPTVQKIEDIPEEYRGSPSWRNTFFGSVAIFVR